MHLVTEERKDLGKKMRFMKNLLGSGFISKKSLLLQLYTNTFSGPFLSKIC